MNCFSQQLLGRCRRYGLAFRLPRRPQLTPIFIAAPFSSSVVANSKGAMSPEKPLKGKGIVLQVGDFAKRQAGRPDFDHSRAIEVTKQPNPDWKYGDGVPGRTGDDKVPDHREIDPFAPGRSPVDNYRLLVSGIAPRPIGFLSTVSGETNQKTGKLVQNLAPFSYFQLVDHDPPTFVVGFSSRPGRPKDTYRHLVETGEVVINTVSEDMIEAVNATSLDAPYGVSEWDVSGLTEAPSRTVKPSRVKESVLSIEGRVVDRKEMTNHQREGASVAAVVLIEATRFWVREDAVDEDATNIDLEKLRPLGQLGGISYARMGSIFELPRRHWAGEMEKSDRLRALDEANSS